VLGDDLLQGFFAWAAIPHAIWIDNHQWAELARAQATDLRAFNVYAIFTQELTRLFHQAFAVAIATCAKQDMS